MEKIKQLIEDYNTTSDEIFGSDYNSILYNSPEADESIVQFESLVGMQFPNELKTFYKTFGGLTNQDNNESYCFEIFSPSQHFEFIKNGSKDNNYGIIDMFLYSWGYDRYEFEDETLITPEDIKTLNQQYKCFGWYRTDTILESAYYLYFDEKGNFGVVFYDQDLFGKLQQELKKMLAGKAANFTLEHLLTDALAETKRAMIEWNE